MHVFAARMPHESLANFLHDSGLHEAGIERVPEIVESVIPDLGPLDSVLPSGFDPVKRSAVEGEDVPFVLAVRQEKIEEPPGEWDLASLSSGGF